MNKGVFAKAARLLKVLHWLYIQKEETYAALQMDMYLSHALAVSGDSECQNSFPCCPDTRRCSRYLYHG